MESEKKLKRVFLIGSLLLIVFLVLIFPLKIPWFKKSQTIAPVVYQDLGQCNDPKNNKIYRCKESSTPIDLTAKVKQSLEDYNKASDKGQALKDLLSAVKERKKALLLAINSNPQLVLDLSFNAFEYSSFPKEVQLYLEKNIGLVEGKILLREASHDEATFSIKSKQADQPQRVLIATDNQLFIVHEVIPVQVVPGQNVSVKGILLDNNIAVPQGGITVKSQTSSYFELFKKLLAMVLNTAQAYCVGPTKWSDTNLSVSFLPDGTMTLDGKPSKIFSAFNAVAPTAAWQREVFKGFAAWEAVSPFNFYPIASGSKEQVGAYSFNPTDPNRGYGYYPPTGHQYYNADIAGDLWSSGALVSLAAHETGHTLGLCHSEDESAVMHPSYPKTSLIADDIAGIQAIYGARRPDSYESNNIRSNAYSLTVASYRSNVRADISDDDTDWFRMVVPAKADTVTISADSSNLSLLQPEVAVYNSSGAELAKVSASTYSSSASLTVNVTAGSILYIRVIAGSPDFSAGLYKLSAQFSVTNYTCKDLGGACILKGTCSEPFQYDNGQTTDCGAYGLTCCSSVYTEPRVVANPPPLPSFPDPEVNLDVCKEEFGYFSYCQNISVTCRKDRDCLEITVDESDPPSFLLTQFCSSSNTISAHFVTYKCNNPGTHNSYCSVNITLDGPEAGWPYQCPAGTYCNGGVCNSNTPFINCSTVSDCVALHDYNYYLLSFCSSNSTISLIQANVICNNPGTSSSYCSHNFNLQSLGQCLSREYCFEGNCRESPGVCSAPDGEIPACNNDKICCMGYQTSTDQTTHSICSNDGRCVAVPGPGTSQCLNNNDCTVSLTVIKQTEGGDGIFTFKNDTDLATKYLPFGNFTLKTQNGQEQKVFNYSGADIGRSLNIGEKKLPVQWDVCSTDTVNFAGTFGTPVSNICKNIGDPNLPYSIYGYYTYCPVDLKNPSHGGKSNYTCEFKNVERKVRLTVKVITEEDRKFNFDLLYNPDSNNNLRDNWQDSFNFDITTVSGKGEKTFEIVPNNRFYIYENLPSAWEFPSPSLGVIGLPDPNLRYYYCFYDDNCRSCSGSSDCLNCPETYGYNTSGLFYNPPGIRIPKYSKPDSNGNQSLEYWLPAFKNSSTFYGDRDITCIFHNEKIKPSSNIRRQLPFPTGEIEGNEEIEQLPTGEQPF